MRVALCLLTFLVIAGGAERATAQSALERLEQRVRDRLAPAERNERPTDENVGYLGVIADDRGAGGRGVRLLRVVAGSPAERDGLRVDDLVLQVDGQPVRSIDDLAQVLRNVQVGDKAVFSIERNGRVQEMTVTFGRRPAPEGRLLERFGRIDDRNAPRESARRSPPGAGPVLGVRLAPVTPELQTALRLPDTDGAFVAELVAGAPADKAGLPAGATIISINGAPTRTPRDVERMVASAQPGSELRIGYIFDGEAAELTLTLPERSADEELPAPAPRDSVRGPTNAELMDRLRALERRVEELEERLRSSGQRSGLRVREPLNEDSES